MGGKGSEALLRIKELLQKYKPELEREYGVKELGVFGSYVRGEQRPDSDLDLLVEFKSDVKMDLIKFVELEERISELLGMKVDLVMKSGLKPRIGRRILQEVFYL